MSKFVERVFTDYQGNPSFARFAAFFCLTSAQFSFVAGLILPTLASYCNGFASTMTMTALGFYGVSKTEQASAAGLFTKIQGFFGGGANAPTTQPPTGTATNTDTEIGDK